MVDGSEGEPFADARQMVERIVYRHRTGVTWHDLPEAFGPWRTVWMPHHPIASDSTWNKVLSNLTTTADAAHLIAK